MGNRQLSDRRSALPDNSISAILEDREQNIWVGTADGLVRMSAPDVGLLNSRDGLSDDNVSTVYCDRHGSLWLTTATGGIFRYANGRSNVSVYPRRPMVSEFAQPLKITLAHSGSEPTIKALCASRKEEHRGSQRVKDCATTAFRPFSKIATTICGLAQPADSAAGTAPISRITISKTASRTGGFVHHRRGPTRRHAGRHGTWNQPFSQRQVRA